MDGNGTLVWKNGERYEGQVSNGSRHGYGQHSFSAASKFLKYVGYFRVSM